MRAGKLVVRNCGAALLPSLRIAIFIHLDRWNWARNSTSGTENLAENDRKLISWIFGSHPSTPSLRSCDSSSWDVILPPRLRQKADVLIGPPWLLVMVLGETMALSAKKGGTKNEKIRLHANQEKSGQSWPSFSHEMKTPECWTCFQNTMLSDPSLPCIKVCHCIRMRRSKGASRKQLVKLRSPTYGLGYPWAGDSNQVLPFLANELPGPSSSLSTSATYRAGGKTQQVMAVL